MATNFEYGIPNMGAMIDEMMDSHGKAMETLADKGSIDMTALAAVITALTGVQTLMISSRLSDLHDSVMDANEMLAAISDRIGVKRRHAGRLN